MSHREIVRVTSKSRSRGLSLRLVMGLALLLLPAVAQAQKTYPSPEAAAEALTAAVKSGSPEAMNEVLGDDFRRFIPIEGVEEGDADAYLRAWDEQHMVVVDPYDPESGNRVIAAGPGDWTLPIPIVKAEGGWRFDVVEGLDVMKTRRIGRNELSTIASVLAYCDAQNEYAQKDRDGDGKLEFAQRIISTPGQMDGLYWARLEDEDEESPLGPRFGDAQPGDSYHGYYYRILKSQGESAEGGARGYVVDGSMTEGFALIAWPAAYGDSGVMTFIVDQDAVVFQTDLGPETDRRAREIKAFDPRPAQWTRMP